MLSAILMLSFPETLAGRPFVMSDFENSESRQAKQDTTGERGERGHTETVSSHYARTARPLRSHFMTLAAIISMT